MAEFDPKKMAVKILEAFTINFSDGQTMNLFEFLEKIGKEGYQLVKPGDMVDRESFLRSERKLYCEDCSRRKGTKNGKPNVICYEIGEAPCRACGIGDVLDDLECYPDVYQQNGWEVQE